MEPLRGGRLARLSEAEAAPLKDLRPSETVPAWAFRFLQSIPSVTVVLSGMSDLEQLKTNLATFQTKRPLSQTEMNGLLEVAKGMVGQTALPCTACHYCVSHCPKGLDIPELLSLYNEHSFTGGGFLAPMALSAIPEEKRPSACIGCRSCEKVCPQQLKISEAMADFTAQAGSMRAARKGEESMQYDFDTELQRRGTNSVKWDLAGPEELPMWVADMDFPGGPGDRGGHPPAGRASGLGLYHSAGCLV